MHLLIDLLRIISSSKKNPDFLFSKSRGTKMDSLIEAVMDKRISTDQEAINFLYTDQGRKYKYHNLKYRLKNKLINDILTLDPKSLNISNLQQGHYQCIRLQNAATLLKSYSISTAKYEICKLGLRIAEKFELTEQCLFFSKEICSHFAYSRQNKKLFNRYFDKYLEYKAIDEMENEVFFLYCHLITSYNNLRSLQKNSDLVKRNLAILQNKRLERETIRFIRHYYSSICLIHLANQDYSQAIQVCELALTKLNEKNWETPNTKYGYQIFLIQCYLSLKMFDQAFKTYKIVENSFSTTSLNWYSLRYYYFILNMHSKKYDSCYPILNEVLQNKDLDRFGSFLVENFQVFQAYVHFLIKAGKIKPNNLEQKPQRPFRLGRFLNEVPHFSKDKRGLNISILILQILFLLNDHKYSKIIDRTDALNQYCYRYLRKDETFRSNCFIKMLIKMVDADFNRIRTERYVETLWKKLQSVPIHVAEQGIEVEIIPYEDLWPMVLEMLD